DRRHRRKSFARRIGPLFPFAPARQPARGVGFAPGRCNRRTRNLGSAALGIRRAICRPGNSLSTLLGRLSGETGANRILAGPPQPPARSLSLYTPRRIVADRAAGTVNAVRLDPLIGVGTAL